MKTIPDKPETHTGDIEELHENNRQARNPGDIEELHENNRQARNPHRRHRRTT